MPNAQHQIPDYTTDDAASYKAKIDGNAAVIARIGAAYQAYAASTPNMTVKVAAGALLVAGAVVENAIQTTGTITAPVSNSRIDRVVIDATTGVVSVITGTSGVSPSAPALTAGKLPVAQVLLTSASTAITNSMITDERTICFAASSNTDTERIDVASAGTVNLTSSAPNTRHINITGTTTITAFTVATGLTYFVRFAASLTLTNGAGLVTQTGANITTQAGDTCILRATAANTVEVLSYARVAQLTLGTAVNTTSGTAIDFNSIPAWVKRIVMSFNGVSVSGTASLALQIGDAGGIETSGYTGGVGNTGGGVSANSTFYGLTTALTAAATVDGAVTLTLLNASTALWSVTGNLYVTGVTMCICGGSKALSAAPLDRVRLTTSNGTDTFDAGSVNILFEG